MTRHVMRLLLLVGLAGCGDPSSTLDRDGGGSPTDGSMPRADADPARSGFRCTSGGLLSGHPDFDAEVGDHAREGDPLRGTQGFPMGWREIVFAGNQLVTVVGQEVWSSDLGASAPTVHRVAGVNDPTGQALADGPCGEARFANLMDLAVGPHGSLFVMDQTANAVLEITDPFDPGTCEVHYWAGTSTDVASITPTAPPNVGNIGGPGLSARFALPQRMAIDPAGNLYVWDSGNSSIRKIANDADHTVSTLTAVESTASGEPQSVIVDSMLVLDGTLYLYAHDSASYTFLQAIDLGDASKRDVFRGRPDLFGYWDSSAALQAGGLATDGVDLLVYFKGLIFSVTRDGVLTHVAGDPDVRSTVEFEAGYDPAATHAALDVQLANNGQWATAGADSWLAVDDAGDLYFVGSVRDPYIERLDCDR